MSYTETHFGKAIKLEMPKDKEEWAENTLKELKIERDDYYDTAFEQITEEGKYVVVDEQLYLIEDTELDEEGICRGTTDADGNINYVAQFYNGGAGFTEVIEEILRNPDKTL